MPHVVTGNAPGSSGVHWPEWAFTVDGIAGELDKVYPGKGYGGSFIAWLNSTLQKNPSKHVDNGSVPPDPSAPYSWFLVWMIVHNLTLALNAGFKDVAIAGQGAIAGLSKAEGNLTSPLTGLDAIGSFFAKLSDPNLWIRVLEIVGGGLILYIGLKALTTPGNQPVARQTVKSTAKKLAKVVK